MYNANLIGIARQGDVQLALEIFRKLLQEYDFQDKEDVKPNLGTFNLLLETLANASKFRRDASDAAIIMLEFLRTSKEGDLEASIPANTAGSVHEVIQLAADFTSTNIVPRPDAETYHLVMTAMSWRGDPDGVKSVMSLMEEDFHAGSLTNKHDMKKYYTTSLRAPMKSPDRNVSEEAEHILNAILQGFKNGTLEEGPDRNIFRLVIQCLQKQTPIPPDRTERIMKLQLIHKSLPGGPRTQKTHGMTRI
jgi:hypothetical protein